MLPTKTVVTKPVLFLAIINASHFCILCRTAAGVVLPKYGFASVSDIGPWGYQTENKHKSLGF